MRSMPVVLMKPGAQLLASFVGVLVSAGVGPFPEGGLDEAFCLSIGAWCVRPSSAVLEAKRTAGGEGMRTIG